MVCVWIGGDEEKTCGEVGRVKTWACDIGLQRGRRRGEEVGRGNMHGLTKKYFRRRGNMGLGRGIGAEDSKEL